MHLSILIAALLPLLATTLPTKRAGGPISKPIPSTCTVSNPLPSSFGGIGNVNGYQPSPSFTSAHHLYASYFSGYLSVADQWKQCIESCYGYGTVGTCKSALLAYDVPTPKGYYGTEGGVLETACLFYDAFLTEGDFVAAPEGQYVNATAGNIDCGA